MRIADGRPQEALDPIDPVFGQAVGLDLPAPHPVAVGKHGQRRLQHRDRVAQGERDRGVRERPEQGSQLLEVLGSLQHPAIGAP